jgi:hypothetical protein
MLNWLQFQGHRYEFEQLGRRLDALTDGQFAILETLAQKHQQTLNELEITRKNHELLGQKGILAWDLVRYISLCRWGYHAGFLSETEAWDRILAAALRLQQTFDSWQDLQSKLSHRARILVAGTDQNKWSTISGYLRAISSGPCQPVECESLGYGLASCDATADQGELALTRC